MSNKFAKQVEKNFRFLFDNHGFIVTKDIISKHGEFGRIELSSDELLICIEMEYSNFLVSCANPRALKSDSSDISQWESMGMLLRFLGESREERKEPFYYAFFSENKKMDIRMARVAKRLENNYDKILAIFKSEDSLKEFEAFKKEAVEKHFHDLAAKGGIIHTR